MERIVLDTNVLVSAMRSDRGPAYRLLGQVGTGRFEISVSVALVFEYESVLHRATTLERGDFDDLLDYLCSVAHRQKIFYLWRPLLRDPGDDLVLELAVSSGSRTIVTFNKRDFAAADRFGIEVRDPAEYLQQSGESSWEP